MNKQTTLKNKSRIARLRCVPGFTLIEMLVVIFIIATLMALLLTAVAHAKKTAIVIRTQSDLALIGTALQAYKTDFGDFPLFAGAAIDQSIPAASVQGSGQWLDYSNVRGAVLLCRALLSPGNSTTAANGYANPGDDGADGPGFRLRFGTGGKVFGPYVDSSKFKVGYLLENATYPMAFPVILDSNGNPILYYPGVPTACSDPVEYADPSAASSLTPPQPPFKFNAFDNAGVPSPMVVTASPPPNPMNVANLQSLAAGTQSQPYLLWTAGSDGIFGSDKNGKTDDVTNFDLQRTK